MEKFFYRVQKDEKLLTVCLKFSLCPEKVIKDNKLSREIEAGDILYIEKPTGRVYVAQLFDTYQTIAKKFGVSEQDLREKNGVEYVFYGYPVII